MTQDTFNKLFSEADRLVDTFIDWHCEYKGLRFGGITVRKHYEKVKTKLLYLCNIIELLSYTEDEKQHLLCHAQDKLDLLNKIYNSIENK